MLEINGKEMGSVEKFLYLGDVINAKGNNSDLINDRISRGKAMVIKAMSICDISMGCYTIEILMVLYQSMFLSVVLFNCQAWTKLTSQNIQKLKAIQLKYIKRSLQVPDSTTGVICYMEMGVLPIEYEIDIRRLTFLHHIIQLEENDPVKLVYKQQAKYINEENWHNEIYVQFII